jgi:hypothetical protein
MSTNFKLGRYRKIENNTIPKLEVLNTTLTPPPSAVDYTTGMPADLGMMLNDRLGDCTCAAFYHAIQVWTFHTQNHVVTYPDIDVELLYEKADGYVPNNPNTDQGGNEQHVLTYLLQNGAPIVGHSSHKIAAFVQLNVKNSLHIKSAINDCGVAYIGFTVPSYLMQGEPPAIWDINPNWDGQIEGGHAVILAGYSPQGLKVISWGRVYTMTWAFFDKYVDEAYAIADSTWINKKGVNPLGMSLSALEIAMSSFRG